MYIYIYIHIIYAQAAEVRLGPAAREPELRRGQQAEGGGAQGGISRTLFYNPAKPSGRGRGGGREIGRAGRQQLPGATVHLSSRARPGTPQDARAAPPATHPPHHQGFQGHGFPLSANRLEILRETYGLRIFVFLFLRNGAP